MAPKDELPEQPEQPPRFSVSRRDFLKTAGISSLAAGVVGVADAEAQTTGGANPGAGAKETPETGAGAKEIRLKPGRYQIAANKEGKVVGPKLVTVTRNGRQIVRVSQEPALSIVADKGSGVPSKDPDRRAAE